MIKLLRIDERFVHGQVAFAWTNTLGADCILIANDEVAQNKLQQKTLKLAVPAGTLFVVKTIKDAIEALNGEKIKKYKVFTIVNSVDDALKLAQGSKEIKSVNLGNIKKQEGKTKLTSSIYVNQEEIEKLQEIQNLGVELECRAVPTDSKVNPLQVWEEK